MSTIAPILSIEGSTSELSESSISTQQETILAISDIYEKRMFLLGIGFVWFEDLEFIYNHTFEWKKSQFNEIAQMQKAYAQELTEPSIIKKLKKLIDKRKKEINAKVNRILEIHQKGTEQVQYLDQFIKETSNEENYLNFVRWNQAAIKWNCQYQRFQNSLSDLSLPFDGYSPVRYSPIYKQYQRGIKQQTI